MASLFTITSFNLDGNNGFSLSGNIQMLNGVGDINGDGFDDLLASENYSYAYNYTADTRIRFGSGEVPIPYQVTSFTGLDNSLQRSHSVSGAGDINGDGIDDAIVGVPLANSAAGASYLIFGSTDGFDESFNLASLNGTNGFVVRGINSGDEAGHIVNHAGDINGDGIDDVVIGASSADPNGRNSGQSYVVFGSDSGFVASLSLANLNGINGFMINGIAAGDRAGEQVSSAGDFNGDGIDDLLISAPNARNEKGQQSAGQSYVIFGSDSGFSATVDLSNLDGTNGFVINGLNRGDRLGQSISEGGDVNGDGLSDILLGAPFADASDSQPDSGQIYVILGADRNHDADFDLAALNGQNGFVINGQRNNQIGRLLSTAGDMNADGMSDIAFTQGAVSYVVLGFDDPEQSAVELRSLRNGEGFRIEVGADELLPKEIHDAGDINGDGIDDLIVSGSDYSSYGRSTSSRYVIFGVENLGTGATQFDDRIEGDHRANTIRALFGDDIVDGLGGNDSLFGGGGKDKLAGGNRHDRIFGGDGSDRLLGNRGNDRLRGNNGDDLLRGNAGNDQLLGQAGEDVLFGNGGNDRLNGGKSVDEINAGSGNDVIIVRQDRDRIKTGQGRDQINIGQNGFAIVLDFNKSRDQIKLIGALRGVTFEDLQLRDRGNDVLIVYEGDRLAKLKGLEPNDLSPANFM